MFEVLGKSPLPVWHELKPPASNTRIADGPLHVASSLSAPACLELPQIFQIEPDGVPSVWTACLLLSVLLASLATLSWSSLQRAELIMGSSLPSPNPDLHVNCLKPDLTHPEITDNGAFSKGKWSAVT